VTDPLYSDATPLWPDDDYPYRVGFDMLEQFEYVAGSALGPEAVEALRQSSCVRGAPFLAAGAPVIERLLGLVAELPLPPTEDAADDERYIRLPPETDRLTQAITRREQRWLRRRKFKGAAEITCALCGRTLPAGLVWTAHIKKRSACGHAERGDLANIMGACTLGCDDLYECGYLFVDEQGMIRAGDMSSATPDLKAAVAELDGKHCSAASADSAPYFAWHRSTVAKACT
jgi:hypothetical protein